MTENGVDVLFYDPWKNQIEGVDLCHVFSVDSSMVYHVRRAVSESKPVLVSPVFSFYKDPLWKTTLKVKLSEHIPGMLNELVQAKFSLCSAARVLALHSQERQRLIKVFGLSPQRCVIVPNGINDVFKKADAKLFRQKYGVIDFVLQVGSINHNKNQLALIKAVSGLPHNLVIVGGVSDGSEKYMEQCRTVAGNNVIFTGQFDYNDPMLASAFAAAKLFVLPSYTEVMPLTLYEAASAGCRVAVSKNLPVCEQIRQYVATFDPNKPRQLAAIIVRQMQLGRDDTVKEIVAHMPSWKDVGRQIKGIYQEVLAERQGFCGV